MGYRQVVSVLAAGLMLCSTQVWALGLGDLTVTSKLGSPFAGKIELLGTDREAMEPEEFLVRIQQTRNTQLLYRVESDSGKSVHITLYSQNAIKDPIFEVDIQLEWDNGQVSRSYTVLVDPRDFGVDAAYSGTQATADLGIPVTGQSGHASESPVAAETKPRRVTAPEEKTPVADSSQSSVTESTADATPASGLKEYGPTVDGNSLWRVARNVKGSNSNGSIYQWMYGIWLANRDKFLDANMHRLKVGVVLSIPPYSEISDTPRSMAYRTYVEHRGAQTARADTSPAEKIESVSEDKLQPLGSANAAGSDAAQPVNIDSAELQSSEPAEIPTMGENMQSVAVADGSFSATGSAADNEDSQAGNGEATKAPAADEIVESGGDFLTTALDGAGAGDSPALTDVHEYPEPAADAVSESDEISEISTQADAPAMTPETDLILQPVATLSDSSTRMEPDVDNKVLPEDSRIAQSGPDWKPAAILNYLADSSNWTAMLIGSLLTLVLMLVFRPRQSRPAGNSNNSAKLGVPLDSIKDDNATIQGSSGSVMNEGPERVSDKDEGSVTELEKSPDTVSGEPSGEFADVLSSKDVGAVSAEADVLMAYGSADKAIALLKDAMRLYPDLVPVRVHLLKVYYRAKDKAAFAALMGELQGKLDNLSRSEQARVEQMCSEFGIDTGISVENTSGNSPDRIERDVSTSEESEAPDDAPLSNVAPSTDDEANDDFSSGSQLSDSQADSISNVEITGLDDETIDKLDSDPETSELPDGSGSDSTLDTLNLLSDDIDERSDEFELDWSYENAEQDIGDRQVQDGGSSDESSYMFEDLRESTGLDTFRFEFSEVDDGADTDEETVESVEDATGDDSSVVDNSAFANEDFDETIEIDMAAFEASQKDQEIEEIEDVITDLDDSEEIVETASQQDESNDIYEQPVNARILSFPDTSTESALRELESETLQTLQVIRDQMQQLNERLFKQERENHYLRQKLDELTASQNYSMQGKISGES